MHGFTKYQEYFKTQKKMKVKWLFTLALVIICSASSHAVDENNIIAVIVAESGEFERFDTPVSVSLDDVTKFNESSLQLYEIDGDRRIPVPMQISTGEERRIHWLMSGRTGPGISRTYNLVQEEAHGHDKRVSVRPGEGNYVMYLGDKPVIQYNHETVYPPEGHDTIYRRSGFIHPLYAPDGTVLTEIQPPDHMHHYGIWNPWTKTTFRGKEVDFWNLAKGEGRVRTGGISAVNEGDVFGNLQVLHEHIAWPGKDNETIAMTELQDIRLFNRSDGSYMLDITSRMNPTERLVLEEYRYGGFVIRATAAWNNQTSDFYSSRGLDRDQADGERAEWCVLSGESSGGRSGIMMMGHPANYNHPEPLRVWPSNANRGKGDQFINFSPTRNTTWVLEPGTSYMLRYRILVFDGEMDRYDAETRWNDYSNPPRLTVENIPESSLCKGAWDNRTGVIKGSRVLVFTRVGEGGFVHSSTPAAVMAIRKLAAENEFIADITEDPADFNDENLKRYDALVFANTNNDVFSSDDQRIALKRYIQAGGGFVGIHIAVGTERNWDWYKRMIGATFDRHPPYQKFDVRKTDGTHPSVRHLPDPWTIEDEPYYVKEYNPNVRVLLAHDLSTIDDRGDKPTVFGNYYPSVWCNNYDGGRQWYTGYGHDDHIFSDWNFMQHILWGIKWVIADGSPDYRKAYSTKLNN